MISVSCFGLLHQYFFGFQKILAVFFAGDRVVQFEGFELFDNHFGDGRAGEPFMVCGDDVPRRVFCAGVIKGVLESTHVVVPIGALFDVGKGKLPVFLRCIDARQETAFLFFLREIEKEFQYHDPVPNEILFKIIDLVKAVFPKVLSLRSGRQSLQIQELRMDANDQHLFVVRTVKNPDPPPRSGRAFMVRQRKS